MFFLIKGFPENVFSGSEKCYNRHGTYMEPIVYQNKKGNEIWKQLKEYVLF